jgi:hypothetical protein
MLDIVGRVFNGDQSITKALSAWRFGELTSLDTTAPVAGLAARLGHCNDRHGTVHRASDDRLREHADQEGSRRIPTGRVLDRRTACGETC